MRDNIKLLLNDKLIKIAIFTSFILIIVQTILTFIFSPNLPPLIPLFNSRPWGTERLFASTAIYFLPVSFVIVFLFNNILSASIYKKNTLTSRILSFNSLLFMLLGILAFMQILFLVF